MHRINLFIIYLLFLTACSTEKEPNTTENNVALSTETADKIQQSSSKNSKAPNIMTPLAGTHPCYEYVELIREPNDVETYRSLGDSILLKENEPAKDDHRTYIGIIGAMLKKDKSIAEIRQAILTTCQTLKSKLGSVDKS